MQKPLVQISIISDVVCPWCYIGKRRIEKAIETLKNDYTFKLEYLPFELNPDMPESGRNQKDYLTAKFGSEERFRQITQHVTGLAKQEGLEFNFDKQNVSPNTKAAHRIIWQAKSEGKQIELVEALFKAYFTDGIDLTKRQNLVTIALSAGLSQASLKAALHNDESLQAVSLSQAFNRQMGVSGVPYYIINQKYALSGAQPADVFVEAFKEISQKENIAG